MHAFQKYLWIFLKDTRLGYFFIKFTYNRKDENY